MVDITEISAIVAAAGVLVGVVYYILDMRNQSKMRLTDTTFRLYSGASTKEAVEAYTMLFGAQYADYDEFLRKYGSIFSGTPVQTALGMVGMSMEGIGLSVKKKLVDIDVICELFPIQLMWDRVKPVAEGVRKQFNNPHYMEWAEYLYNEYMRYIQKREQQLQRGA